MALRTLLVIFLSVIGIWAKSIPISARSVDAKGAKQDGNRLVFAHFMVYSAYTNLGRDHLNITFAHNIIDWNYQ
jgi:hypothetical protein